MALQASQSHLEGVARVGPALSATSYIEDALRASESIGLNLYPWQVYALDVSMSANEDGWLYREVAIVVARQNGKTELLVPRILAGLEVGERILHTAQNRILPRNVFKKLAPHAPDGSIVRWANGQETIEYPNGGSYRILAPQKGFRGESGDLLIIDEVREATTFDLVAAAEPTISASANPQIIYLSNAGDDESIVLNDLRQRGMDTDSSGLAYMEWSADPDYEIEDERGWLQANPSIGYGNQTIERLKQLYDKYKAANELAIFETEHLCRWVVSMMPRLVADNYWQMARRATGEMRYPHMGISVDPNGQRVSVAYAWKQSDGSIGLMARDFHGEPIDTTRLAIDLVEDARKSHVRSIGFDPWTDQHLARHFENAIGINGQEYSNASERFVRTIETGQLRWELADAVSADLPYASRKPTGTGTSWMADRAKSDRSITAVLASIRAVWLASAPQQAGTVY